MKEFIAILLIALGGYFAPVLLPQFWWAVFAWAALVAFLLHIPSKSSFLTGFMAIATLWGGICLLINQQNGGILGDTIGAVFQLNGWAMIGLTALLGGVLGGLSTSCGSLGRQLFVKTKKAEAKPPNSIETEVSVQ